jgi:hypothetical protein
VILRAPPIRRSEEAIVIEHDLGDWFTYVAANGTTESDLPGVCPRCAESGYVELLGIEGRPHRLVHHLVVIVGRPRDEWLDDAVDEYIAAHSDADEAAVREARAVQADEIVRLELQFHGDAILRALADDAQTA